MDNQISTIERFNGNLSVVRYADKSGVIRIANEFVESIIEGGGDRLTALAVSSKLQLFLKTIDSQLIEHSLNEMQMHNGKAENSSVKLELAETGVAYDYSENENWVKLSEQIDSLNEARKKMEAFIRTLEKPKSEVDEETGEIIKWFPASKKSTTTIKRTIK